MKKIQEILLILVSFFSFFPILRIQIKEGIYLNFFKIFLVIILAICLSKLRKIKGVKIIGFYILWMLYSLISIFWVYDIKNYIVYNVYLFIIGIIVFIFLNIDLTDKIILNILKSSYIAIIIHIVLGSLQLLNELFYLKDIPYYKFMQSRNIFYPISTFSNPNDFAIMLNYSITISLILFKTTKNILKKNIYIIILIWSLFLILKTESRGGILGAVIILSLFSRKKGLIFLGIISSSIYIRKFFSIINGNSLNSEGIRINLIKNILFFLKETSFKGVGAGNANYWLKNFYKYDVLGNTSVHNKWAEILVNYGVIIFIGQILIYIFLCYKSYLLYKKIYKNKKIFYGEITIGYGIFFTSYFLLGMISSGDFGSEWINFAWGIFIFLIIKFKEKVV